MLLIMSAVTAATGGVAIGVLYLTAFNEQRTHLFEMVQSRARLMEAIARFDQAHSSHYPEGPKKATLSQIVDSHAHHVGFGQTGEFTLAQREGDNIVFVLSHRHANHDEPQPVAFHSHLAEPMRRALSGQSGTVVGLDYRGVMVLAAYEPVAVLDMGIVGKMDLAEIRAPFRRAGGIVLGVALILIAAGMLLFFGISNPMLRRLRDSEATFRGIATAAQDAILLIDRDGKIVYCNPVVQSIFGYADRELLGKDLHQLLASRRYLAAYTEGFKRFRETGTGPVLDKVLEVDAVHKDGREIPVELSVAAVPTGDGRSAVGIVRDISARKEKEAQLRQAQKMQAVGQLTGGIAHDFNNLLTIIQGNLNFLKETVGQDTEAVELVDDALSAARDGGELTQRLLAFSRKQTLRPKRVDINAMLRDFERFLRRTLRDDIELKIRQGPDTPTVLVDPGQLENALLNLVINARDALPGGGTLTIEAICQHIDPAMGTAYSDLTPGKYITVSVSDTGIGMAPEDAARAVEPFFTTKPYGQGSGLGLSMVYGFVRQSGGDLLVNSELGKGTTVSMLMPQAHAVAKAGDEHPATHDLPRGTETVLVLEDQSQVRRLAKRSLEGLGYRVLDAENAVAAMEILREEAAVDLLFSDIVLPGAMDGRELASRAVEDRPGLKVLLTTGFAKESAGDPSAESSDFPLLKKPYSKEHLADMVRNVLDTH